MWLMCPYKSCSLFSLKLGTATSSGAKTLLLPTPYAVRTALLDATIRMTGITEGRRAFDVIKNLDIAYRAPEFIVITNLFAKVQKPPRSKSAKSKSEDIDEEEDGKSWTRTVAFREYAYVYGEMGIAFSGNEPELDYIKAAILQINYFGKRGSFFQLLEIPKIAENLPGAYFHAKSNQIWVPSSNEKIPVSFPLGIIQVLDDWGPELTFDKLNNYNDEKVLLHKDRLRWNVVFPYRLSRSSKSFTFYERFDKV